MMSIGIGNTVSNKETLKEEPMEEEQLINSQKFLSNGLISKEKVERAIENALKVIDLNMDYFGEQFPSPNCFEGTYKKIDNIEWTNGFWTGMIWLAYEYTGNGKYKDFAMKNVESFKHRIDNLIEVDHHDLGFLYIPSCLSAYELTGSAEAHEATLLAAKQLSTRFQPKGGFIQAWGKKGADDNYRLIIDALLNIPILYWAGKETNNQTYIDMADSHYKQATSTVIRENGSTFHTYFYDSVTGKPLRGATHQGYSDDSSWARGQAWAVYGIPIHAKYETNDSDLKLFEKVTNYFLNRLPKDNVPYWDLIFNDGDDQSRDSSAGAIAVCGMDEMMKSIPESNQYKLIYKYAMHSILNSLIDNYSQKNPTPGAPVLEHGVYSWHSGKGVDEGNIWGDYYYLEALIRFYKNWEMYW